MMTSSCKRVGSKRERLLFLLKEGKDSQRQPFEPPPIPTYKFSLVIFPLPSSQNLIQYPNTFPELITLGNLITFSSHLVILWGEDWLWSLLWLERVVKPKLIKQHKTNPRPEKCNLSSQSGQRELKPLHLFKGTHVLLFMYKYFVQIFKGNEEGSYFIQSLLSWLVLIGVGFSAWTILMDAVLCKWWHLHGRELV